MNLVTLDELKRLEEDDPTVPAGFRPFFDRTVPVDITSDIGTGIQSQVRAHLFA
jgi:hypothetical protein